MEEHVCPSLLTLTFISSLKPLLEKRAIHAIITQYLNKNPYKYYLFCKTPKDGDGKFRVRKKQVFFHIKHFLNQKAF
jgi:hypothetical protein